MVICGSLAAKREPVYVGNSGVYVKNERFLQPEIIVSIAAFSFVFGCRYGVGVDYFHYLDAYQYNSGTRFEFLFRYLSNLLRAGHFHYAVYFSLWAFLQITLFYYAFRNQRFLYPLLAFFLIVGYGYMSWMNIIRQEIASGVFLVSLQFLDKRKPGRYFLCVVIAFLFHKASILLFVFYPLFLWRKDIFRKVSWQLLVYLVAMIIASQFRGWFMQLLFKPYKFFSEFFNYQNYVYRFLQVESLNSRAQFQASTGYGIYVSVFRVLPIILMSRKLKEFYSSSFFNIVYSLWFIRVISGILAGGSIILNRPFAFFSNFNMIMYSYFTYYCFKSKKPLWQFFGVCYMMVFLIMFIHIVNNGASNTSEFLFFWQIL